MTHHMTNNKNLAQCMQFYVSPVHVCVHSQTGYCRWKEKKKLKLGKNQPQDYENDCEWRSKNTIRPEYGTTAERIVSWLQP